jgi:DHA1 family bicyclomycin/chloramphenicol resistance-like MFS transporter
MVLLGLLNARLVRHFPVRRLLVVGLVVSAVAAVALLIVVSGGSHRLMAVLLLLLLVVATRGVISSNATVLAVQRSPRAGGSASAVLGACMFSGGIVVSPLLGLGPDRSALPMVSVVAAGAVVALVTTLALTGQRAPARNAGASKTN